MYRAFKAIILLGKHEQQQMYLSRISDMAFNAEDISIKISELGTLSTFYKIKVLTGFWTSACIGAFELFEVKSMEKIAK